ncbi:MAG: HutD family protein [Usitatibacter sp.]
MKIRHLKAENYRRQAWKNGGGFTTELAMEPNGEQWLWRLSIARVERSGPFSDFAGYERTIMLLSGDGMELDFGAAPSVRIVRREEPFVFDGGWKTTCRLIGGPVKDMNMMVDRKRAQANLRTLALTQEATIVEGSQCTLLYVLRGGAGFFCPDRDMAIARGELLRIDGGHASAFQLRAMQPDTAIVAVGISLE